MLLRTCCLGLVVGGSLAPLRVPAQEGIHSEVEKLIEESRSEGQRRLAKLLASDQPESASFARLVAESVWDAEAVYDSALDVRAKDQFSADECKRLEELGVALSSAIDRPWPVDQLAHYQTLEQNDSGTWSDLSAAWAIDWRSVHRGGDHARARDLLLQQLATVEQHDHPLRVARVKYYAGILESFCKRFSESNELLGGQCACPRGGGT